jgi:hypothetical protein
VAPKPWQAPRSRSPDPSAPAIRVAPVDRYDWLLFLHLLAAFGMVASVVVFTVVFAIDLDGYEVWDGWILAAIVLWAIAAGAGIRLGMGYQEALDRSRGEGALAVSTDRSALLYGVMTVAVAALLVVMIYKPGA